VCERVSNSEKEQKVVSMQLTCVFINLEILNFVVVDSKQKTTYQTAAKMVFSTMKSENFCVKLEVSLEDYVYLETYYHHSQDDTQVDETITKIQI
jgi:hypothetical protein